MDTHVTLRMVALVAIAVGLNAGPIWTQLLGGSPPIGPTWRMFGHKGTGLIVPTYVKVGADGRAEILDHTKVTYARGGPPRRIEDRAALDKLTRAVCAQEGEAADIRLTARLATREGWELLADGAPACAPMKEARP